MVFIIILFHCTFTAVLNVFLTNFLVRFFFVTTSYSYFNNVFPSSGNSKRLNIFIHVSSAAWFQCFWANMRTADLKSEFKATKRRQLLPMKYFSAELNGWANPYGKIDWQNFHNMVIELTTGFIFILILFSKLSLALNIEGLWLTKTDTQPERTLWLATHQSKSWYTPLVEVNQAILAWSF